MPFHYHVFSFLFGLLIALYTKAGCGKVKDGHKWSVI